MQNDAIAANYIAKQYVEFSVNLTKLGLDPVTSITGDPCGMPFRRLLVKTRASASFTAQLKDFVAPLAMFVAPSVDIATASPTMCNHGSVAEIHVTNPISSSTYQWTTPNGHIFSVPTGPSILVDTPGTYIVTQYLMAGCAAYAIDTVQIFQSFSCIVLPANLSEFRGTLKNGTSQLTWKVLNNQLVQYFLVQRSTDGIEFTTVGRVEQQESLPDAATYTFADDVSQLTGKRVYYRLLLLSSDNSVKYSNTISLSLTSGKEKQLVVFPNPAKDVFQIQVQSSLNTKMRIDIYDASAKLVVSRTVPLQPGLNAVTLDDLADKPRGMYMLSVYAGDEVHWQKLMKN